MFPCKPYSPKRIGMMVLVVYRKYYVLNMDLALQSMLHTNLSFVHALASFYGLYLILDTSSFWWTLACAWWPCKPLMGWYGIDMIQSFFFLFPGLYIYIYTHISFLSILNSLAFFLSWSHVLGLSVWEKENMGVGKGWFHLRTWQGGRDQHHNHFNST